MRKSPKTSPFPIRLSTHQRRILKSRGGVTKRIHELIAQDIGISPIEERLDRLEKKVDKLLEFVCLR